MKFFVVFFFTVGKEQAKLRCSSFFQQLKIQLIFEVNQDLTTFCAKSVSDFYPISATNLKLSAPYNFPNGVPHKRACFTRNGCHTLLSAPEPADINQRIKIIKRLYLPISSYLFSNEKKIKS